MKIVVLPSADRELQQAADFYGEQLPMLRQQFLDDFSSTVDFIAQFPSAWRQVGVNIRKGIFKRFPYIVLYTAESDAIVISAVAHQHRRPESYLPPPTVRPT
jgi:plasmid stabilization system protein ParE